MRIDKTKTVNGYKIWDFGHGAFSPLKSICRDLSSESTVLLKNENRLLPFGKNEKLAVFGRMQQHYYKSGHGSGGNVRAAFVPSFIEAISSETDFIIDRQLEEIYSNWVKENPFDNGNGWATEPFSQKEMPISEETVSNAAERNDSALIILGRASGEDKDNENEKGSFLLSDGEEEMIKLVTRHFSRVALIINSGNIIDLSFIEKYNIPALMYVWQCGEQGALAVADMLCGRVSPSGKLADTQARRYVDYPSAENFGNEKENLYCEDIYVGYRYFETFDKDRVLFPFGFGLSYADFQIEYKASQKGEKIEIVATVKNIGEHSGKEVVQIYYKAPHGRLGNPEKQLIAFKKTKTLKPGEGQTLTLSFNISDMASYDDECESENAFCYLLLEGKYEIFAGTDCRSCEKVLTYESAEETVIKKLRQALAPKREFMRIAARERDGKTEMVERPVPQRQYSLSERAKENLPPDIEYTGDKGIKLLDVAEGRNSLDEFVAQFGRKELCELVCGEGMSSFKAPRGATGAVMGGVTPSLSHFGLPVVCLTDGPAGLRFDGEATSIPIGTALACTFNTEAVLEMATLLGIEIFANDIDILLGCGMNIHRNVLCGRNFEYFSEDPLLAGSMAAAMYKGVSRSGTNVTIKHFAGNGQEKNRRDCDTVVSERALREIYLKGFEIAVKAGADVIMTAYNPINGNWAASNYDLTKTILRDEWGFNGFVMSDWWADLNWDGSAPRRDLLGAMIHSGNDIYMVCPDATSHSHDLIKCLDEGFITIGELQASAKNILRYILSAPAFLRYVDGGCKAPNIIRDDSWMKEIASAEDIESGREIPFTLDAERKNICVELRYECLADSLSQIPIEILTSSSPHCTVITGGTDGKIITEKRFLNLWAGEWKIKLSFSDKIKVFGIKIKN